MSVPALQGSAQQMSGVAAELAAGISAIDAHVDGLIGKSWSGDASAAYGKVWQQWHEGADSVASGLSGLARLMNESGQHYRRIDEGE